MTRCSYIPPEGQSVIAIAKERGGATDGDIEALRDRFGCRAESTRIIGRAGSTAIDAHACDDHVGHLLGDAQCAWVEPVGSVHDENYSKLIEVGPLPKAMLDSLVFDFDTNPTREQLSAAGFNGDSAAYREALRAFEPITADERSVGIARPAPTPAGSIRLRPPTGDPLVIRCYGDRPHFNIDTRTLRIEAPISWDDAARLRRLQDAHTVFAVDWAIHNMECAAVVSIAVRPHRGDNNQWFDAEIDLREIRVTPRQLAPSEEAIDKLRELQALRKPVTIETSLGKFGSMAPASQVDLRPANRPTDEGTTCPATFSGSMHTYVPGAERCFCGKYSPPPYAPGDEVEWRTGPLDQHWHRGRIISVVDDRPDDGIDKPCWRVCVDTASPRSFLSPAVIATCLRPAVIR